VAGYLLALLLALVGAAGIASAVLTRRRVPGQRQTLLLIFSALAILLGLALAAAVYSLRFLFG